ncbi:hypothetical protein SBA2_30119 [Acidobacteriia bacterium SbA2]|nr:hypothetical protein SBA2_30119 [Acidobacteriia bacterium SbA2]
MRPFTYLYGRIPLHHHEHVAVLYRGREEAFRAASFLAEGLKHNNLCVYLAPDDYQAEMLSRLRAFPVEVDCHTRDGSLRVHHGSDTLQLLQQWTKAVFDDAERAAVPSLRWLEEGLWPASLGFPMPHFFEFHAPLNYQVKHYPCVTLCQYDLERIETPHLLTAITVHRHLVVEGALVRDNPFYVPAEKFLPMSAAERERDLLRLFRDVQFDVSKLLSALTGYAQVQQALSNSPEV